ncbi:TPA: hypothetical protein ACTC22_000684, partial [Neisseria meningitidis]
NTVLVFVNPLYSGFIRQDGFLPQRKIVGLPVKSAVCPGAAGALGFRRHIFGMAAFLPSARQPYGEGRGYCGR